MKRDYFKDWNYKKHAKTVTAIYAIAYLADMTLGYVLAKKVFNGETLRNKKAVK